MKTSFWLMVSFEALLDHKSNSNIKVKSMYRQISGWSKEYTKRSFANAQHTQFENLTSWGQSLLSSILAFSASLELSLAFEMLDCKYLAFNRRMVMLRWNIRRHLLRSLTTPSLFVLDFPNQNCTLTTFQVHEMKFVPRQASTMATRAIRMRRMNEHNNFQSSKMILILSKHIPAVYTQGFWVGVQCHTLPHNFGTNLGCSRRQLVPGLRKHGGWWKPFSQQCLMQRPPWSWTPAECKSHC